MPAMKIQEITKAVMELVDYIKNSGNKYFMLLNKERSDYTIFIYIAQYKKWIFVKK